MVEVIRTYRTMFYISSKDKDDAALINMLTELARDDLTDKGLEIVSEPIVSCPERLSDVLVAEALESIQLLSTPEILIVDFRVVTP